MELVKKIEQEIFNIINTKFGIEPNEKQIQVQKTRKEIDGDYTINVFPLLKLSKKKPEETAEIIGEQLTLNIDYISDYNIIKGFLNININSNIWINFLKENLNNLDFGYQNNSKSNIMVEYSSPNTNKPLHLGHIRNNLLGHSVSTILKAAGNKVTKVNLVNDRGIHICKSMLAWQKFGKNKTPDDTNTKGDKFVGEYYVKFDKEYKKEIAELVEKGL
jgi:arginyl-tRNA synthetase